MTGAYTDLSVYDYPRTACPLCAGESIRTKYTITRYSLPFNIDMCRRCGFMFMNPRFNDGVVSSFYNEDYYRGNAEYSYYDEREAEKFARHVWDKRIKVLNRYARGGNFLDIGAAFGGLMRAASRYFTPYGIELSPYAGTEARRRFGSAVHIGTLDNHPFSENFFSAITMIEVIEHLPDPKTAVRECYRLLKKGGVLALQTANMDGMQTKLLKDRYAYFMPGHLSYFTRKNCTSLLHDAGFSRVKVFLPVEFGLLPKLMKSRYTFTSWLHYLRWLKITRYHLLSKLHYGNFAATSSMVVYAIK